MSEWTLTITDYIPAWQPGQPVPDTQILDALANVGVIATYTAIDPLAGTVTLDAETDPAAALAGVPIPIGPSDADRARAQAINDYKTAVQAVRSATTAAEVASAVPPWERATTAVLRLIVADLNA